ncbi:hypothetical protein Tco_0747495 [Tanacetum coccineum]|uniref:Uncharacterized protein n=1 Tax=Tanacetum coccineum TaxID=301880 RepID=A0ABQ4YSZ9_9ASTR
MEILLEPTSNKLMVDPHRFKGTNKDRNGGAVLEACLVTKGIEMDDSLVAKESTDDFVTLSEQLDERNDVDANIGPSYDSDTVSEVYHGMFKNMFVHGIQNPEQPESIPDTYVVNKNNSNIISDTLNMDPDRDKEEHDYVDHEQQRAFFASLINNLKCDVEKCNKVNREAQQANALLTNELERYKENEKHFVKDKTIESEYCKKIKLLNDEISNLKSQACVKDKTFAKENEKYDELRKAGQTDQTLRMLLPKEDNVNTGKHGLGFENQNDDVNPSLLNKAKELVPCLYNIDEMGKELLSDYKIISKEELKCEAEKRLKVKQRKFPLSYHDFVYGETQFNEPPKVPLKKKRCYFEKTIGTSSTKQNSSDPVESAISESHSHVYENEMFKQIPFLESENICLKKTVAQLQKDFSKLEAQSIDFEIALQHKIQENNSLKIMQTENENCVASLQIENAHLKQTYKDLFQSIQSSRDAHNKSDDIKLKFDFDEIETQNIELEHQSRVQTQSSNVSQNEAENLKSQLSEFADKKFENVFQKIESIKKKRFDFQISNDFLQRSVYDFDSSNVESESEEKKILFRNETSSFETKIKEIEMTLAQQTKDFEDVKVDFSKKTYKFETYFEKLKNTKVVLERQLDRKIQDSNAEKISF